MDKKSATCPECKKILSSKYSLRRHIEKYHADKVSELIPKKKYSFTCEICSKKFNYLNNFKVHKRNHEQGRNDNSQENVKKKSRPTSMKKCPLCTREDKKPLLIQHFINDHEITIQSTSHVIANTEDFIKWKAEVENATNSKYIRKYGYVVDKTLNYVCHRSGTYVSKGNGKRHLKMQGSSKIDAFCPATIKVVKQPDGTYCVTYISTHIGHTNELSHLNLKQCEREMLADKIAMKIPFDTILDEVRDTVSETKMDRLHLLSKKDLHNIANAFHLSSAAVKHTNDTINIDSWVKEMRNNNNSILFYKAQVCKSEHHPELKENDFVLIIMNSAQCEILKEYSADCICIDRTFVLNSYDFELTTLLVMDDIKQGFPCAFLISNRSDTLIMTIFFNYIKTYGGIIKTKVFMSDMAESFYDAWLAVMPEAEFRLYCTWHVDQAWRKNLNKIKSRDKQVIVYKTLRTLLEETDVSAFERIIKTFIDSSLSDVDTREFATYFKENYLKQVESWAYCHRLHTGVNFNMHIERLHKTIKYIYLNGKGAIQLDKSIEAIMKFVKDELFDQLLTLHNKKLSSKIKNICWCHTASEDLPTNLIVATKKNSWQYPSSKSLDMYVISEVKSDCKCQLLCQECNICIHKYSCTCLDSAIQWNMCKHVHLICRYLKAFNEDIPDVQPASENEEEHNISAISAEVINKEMPKLPSFAETKAEYIQSVQTFMEEKITSFSDIDIFKSFIGLIGSALDVQSSNCPQSDSSKSQMVANENIYPQQRRRRKGSRIKRCT